MSDPDTVKLYITGHLLEGTNRGQAMIKLADLLKTSPAKIAKLIDGNPHLIKKDLPTSKVEAYQRALAEAGFETLVKTGASAGGGEQVSAPSAATAAPASATPEPADSLALLELGTLVLAENERAPKAESNISTEHLNVSSDDAPIEPPKPAAAPVAAPDIDVAEYGAAIENIAKPPPPPPPNTDQLSAAEPGAELGKPKPKAPPAPDVSHLSLDESS